MMPTAHAAMVLLHISVVSLPWKSQYHNHERSRITSWHPTQVQRGWGSPPAPPFSWQMRSVTFGAAARLLNNWANTIHIASSLANHRHGPTTDVLFTQNTAAMVLLHISVVTSYMKEIAAL